MIPREFFEFELSLTQSWNHVQLGKVYDSTIIQTP